MDLDSFTKENTAVWDSYFTNVYAADLVGALSSSGGKTLYPRLLICTETKEHLLSELVGATPNYDGLVVRSQHQRSTNRYLSQFSGEATAGAISIGSKHSRFRNLTFSQGVAVAQIKERFPFANIYKSVLLRVGGHSSLVHFQIGFESAAFDNCMFINQEGAAIRIKRVLFLAVVSKSLSAEAYRDFLAADARSGRDVMGVHTAPPGRAYDLEIAAQFANMYLWPEMRETTIGEFLKQHPTIVAKALGTKRVLYEPYLEWQEGHEGNTDTAINPDLLLENARGTFDIYDLKTALLDRDRITKGERRRRRFIDYVEEGAAQLAHYRQYFTFRANAAHALQKYGVRVEKPSLVLVVGNYDNVDAAEVDEATRKLSDISVLDYDSFLQLFLEHSGNATATTLE